MIAFIEEVLDICPQPGEGGGPQFNTRVNVLGSGYEQRNIQWEASRWRGNLGNKIVDEAVKDYLLSFFRARRGRAQGFLYKDWTDYKVTDAVLYPTGDFTMQLAVPYEPSGNLYLRDITKPKASAFSMKLNGSPFVDFTLDDTTGIITFTDSEPPDSSDLLTWTGEYYVPVRFDTDEFLASPAIIRDDSAVYELGALPIVEIRV